MAKANQSTKRRQSRGAASIEAVIVLPVFVILFVGIFFVRDLHASKLRADEQARRCAWLYSAAGCEGPAPDGCNMSPASPVYDDFLSSIKSNVETMANNARETRSNGGSVKDVSSGLEHDIKQILFKIVNTQVLARLGSVLTSSYEADRALERERPNLFGGGVTEIHGRYRLACNLKHTTPEEVVRNAWSKVIPW